MKTATRHRALPDDLEARLADYECQANAYLATHRPREGSEPGVAATSMPVAPDLAAPGFVSFTGGPNRQSVKAGAPQTVLPSQAAFYAELDDGILS
jgi:hypothetical protein